MTPSRKWATREEEQSTSQREAALSRRVMEEDILPKRYETFTMDHDWVQWVRGSLLGLTAGVMPFKKDIDTSERFVPQAASLELEPPEVVVDHWLPILQEQGCLTECYLDKFTAVEDWVPLYTPEALEKHLLAAPSAFMSTGPPSLTAMVPPEICMGTDKEFLLTIFHQHKCLVRQSISIGGRCRQLGYCGVVNENSKTTLSHMRKHLNLLFDCRGCYTKSFPHGQALNKHMKSMCHSVLAIREKTRAPRK